MKRRNADRKQSDLFGIQSISRASHFLFGAGDVFHAVDAPRGGLSCRSFLSAKTRREAQQLRADHRTADSIFLFFSVLISERAAPLRMIRCRARPSRGEGKEAPAIDQPLPARLDARLEAFRESSAVGERKRRYPADFPTFDLRKR